MTRTKVKSRSHHDISHLQPLTNIPTKYQLPTPLGSYVAQLVGGWTHNPRLVGSIPGDANCDIFGQDVNLDCASHLPGVRGTWLLVGS